VLLLSYYSFTEKNNAKALLHYNNGINHFAEEVSAFLTSWIFPLLSLWIVLPTPASLSGLRKNVPFCEDNKTL
jgi:hypothetical protein